MLSMLTTLKLMDYTIIFYQTTKSRLLAKKKEKNDMGYSGKLEIPEKVKYAGKEYIVTSIGDWALLVL